MASAQDRAAKQKSGVYLFLISDALPEAATYSDKGMVSFPRPIANAGTEHEDRAVSAP